MTLDIFLPILSLSIGFVILFYCGNKLVDGAVFMAEKFKISPMFIGIAIIGFGTSLPDLLAAISAAMSSSPALAYGSLVGSNIANIGLALALALFFTKSLSPQKSHYQEFVCMLIAMILLGLALYLTQGLTTLTGSLLVIACVTYLAIAFKSGLNEHGNEAEINNEIDLPSSQKLAIFFLIIGFVGLFSGAKLAVYGAVEVAQMLGISERVIGLSVVAVGTSLPEVAATLAAARAGRIGVALGNVAGSNIFNIMAGLGICALVAPMPAVDGLWIDMLIMFIVAALMALLFIFGGRYHKIIASMMLLTYTGYILSLGTLM